MVTPFDENGAVNYDVASQLAAFLVAQGSDGLVVAGSTGEGASLTDDEKLGLFSCVAQSVTVPVLAGSTTSSTESSVTLTSQVASTGVAGVLATTPAYVRPSQHGIAAHFEAIADSTKLPLMIYDIPVRTGRKIASATMVELVRGRSNIVALKDASADLVAAAHTKAVLGDALDLYSGDDGLVLPFIAVGAVGVVSVAAHWAGPEFAQMVRAATKGEWTSAQELNERLHPSCVFESSEIYPNPLPSKAAMRALGFDVGQCRLPLGPSDESLDGAANEIVSSLRAQRG
jgi:4-hydroxy-tetrahydrodipicolinate synthase